MLFAITIAVAVVTAGLAGRYLGRSPIPQTEGGGPTWCDSDGRLRGRVNRPGASAPDL